MAYETVDAQYVQDHLGKMPLIDVRPHEMFVDGRIPGAHNVELMATKAEGGDVAKHMAEKVEALGIKPSDDIIVYCRDGVLTKEASDLLDSQGFNHIHAYIGSWWDWVSDPSRPVEK